jgi:hypothetical protein
VERPMLRMGSRGPAVTELQQALNIAPTALPRLNEDGDFGFKTHGRVKEFQNSNKLGVDGIVGPQTYSLLEEFLKQLPGFIDKLISPATIEAAQDRIVSAANAMHSTFGWNLPLPYVPQPGNPRIAARYCAEPASRLRQGGVMLGQIFAVAGAPTPLQTVFQITQDAESRYTLDKKHPNYFPNWRNNLDIVSWCGIFALFVYKNSGLKMSPWPLKYPVGKQAHNDSHELRVLGPGEAPQKGDLGILQTAENHHFLIVDVKGSQLTTIDGNSDWRFQTITKNARTISAVRSTPGAFLRPVWEKVLRSA